MAGTWEERKDEPAPSLSSDQEHYERTSVGDEDQDDLDTQPPNSNDEATDSLNPSDVDNSSTGRDIEEHQEYSVPREINATVGFGSKKRVTVAIETEGKRTKVAAANANSTTTKYTIPIRLKWGRSETIKNARPGDTYEYSVKFRVKVREAVENSSVIVDNADINAGNNNDVGNNNNGEDEVIVIDDDDNDDDGNDDDNNDGGDGDDDGDGGDGDDDGDDGDGDDDGDNDDGDSEDDDDDKTKKYENDDIEIYSIDSDVDSKYNIRDYNGKSTVNDD